MADDETPRPEFARDLRTWFVAELECPDDDGGDVDRLAVELVPAVARDGAGSTTRPRRWVLVVNAAAIVLALVSLVVVTDRESDTTSDAGTTVPDHADPARAATAPTALPGPAAAITALCQDYALDAAQLPYGASGDLVRSAADDVGARLAVLLSGLAEIASADAPTGEPLAESLRLLAEAVDAADRLVAVTATVDRGSIDEAVLNLDFIVLAIARHLEPLGGDACMLPTLREVV